MNTCCLCNKVNKIPFFSFSVCLLFSLVNSRPVKKIGRKCPKPGCNVPIAKENPDIW